MGPKQEDIEEVLKDGQGILEKLNELFELIFTTEKLRDHPITKLLFTESSLILKCQ